MEAEGPSSSPRGDPQADADAAATTVSSDELMRRLALSESVNLELERALEVKARSLDEATRAVEHLRRELRGAMAANDADGSVPAAAMDAASFNLFFVNWKCMATCGQCEGGGSF